MRGEKFLMMSAKDSLTGEHSGEGDPRAVVVTMLLTCWDSEITAHSE